MVFFFKKQYPIVIPPERHTITRHSIDREVSDIMKHLMRNKFQAYLVGGCVRDILLERKPKDFDIATDARPRQIKRIFKKCFLIGRRFRLAHVYISHDRFVEVATFRAVADPEMVGEGKYAANNVFGSIEEDALRRDFTVNALYYNAADSTVVDYSGGLEDIRKRILRSIGNPVERFTDDPVRIIRAARFCAQLDFKPSKKDFRAAVKCSPLITQSSPARLLEELYKILRSGASYETLMNLKRMGILKHWIPELVPIIEQESIRSRLEVIDRRRKKGEEISNTVMITALLYDLFEKETSGRDVNRGYQETFTFLQESFHDLAVRLKIPRREWDSICNIAARQRSFIRAKAGRNRLRFEQKFIQNVHFPNALLFYAVIVDATGNQEENLNYWIKRSLEPSTSPETTIQRKDQPPEKTGKQRRRRPRRRGPRKRTEPAAAVPPV